MSTANLRLNATANVSDATSGLKNLNNTFDSVTSGMSAAGGQARNAQGQFVSMGNAVDTASSMMRKAGIEAQNMASDTGDAAKSMQELEDRMTSASAKGNILADAFGQAMGAVKQVVGEAVGAFTSFEKSQAQMAAMTAVEMVDLKQFKDFDSALETATEKSKELLDWAQQLAIVSPFGAEDVNSALGVAQAFGFLTTQYRTTQEAQQAGVLTAQRLTEATMNWAAATGHAGAEIQRVTLIAGQIKSLGKLMGGDSMQLKQLGINIEGAIGKSIGKSQQEVVAMREKGLIPAEMALKALTAEMEKFGKAAQIQGNSFGGLIASIQDLKQVALRNLFGGMFEGVKPQLQMVVAALQDPNVLGAMKSFGDRAGQALATGLSLAMSAIQALWGSGILQSLGALFLQAFQMGQQGAQALAPVLSLIVPVLAALYSALQQAVNGGTSFSTALSAVSSYLQPVGAAIDLVKASILSLASMVATASAGLFQTASVFGYMQGAATETGPAFAFVTAVLGTLMMTLQMLGPVAMASASIFQSAWVGAGAIAQTVMLGLPALASPVLAVFAVLAALVQFTIVGAFQTLAAIAPIVFEGLNSAIGLGVSLLTAWATILAGPAVAGLNMLGQVINYVFGALPVFVQLGIDTVYSLASVVGSVLTSAFMALAPVVTWVFQNLPALVNVGLGVLFQLGAFLSTVLVGAFSVVGAIAAAVWPAIAAAISIILPPLFSLAMIIGQGLMTAFTMLTPIAGTLFSNLAMGVQLAAPLLTQIATTIATYLVQGLTLVGGLVQTAFAALPGILAIVMPPLVSLGTIIGQFLVTAFQTIAPLAYQAFGMLSSVVASALPFVQGLATVVGSVLLAAFQAAVPIVGTVISVIGSLLPGAAQVAGAAFQVISAAARILFPILQMVAGFVGGVLVAAFKVLQVVVPPVISALGSFASFLLGAVAGALRGIAGVLTWAADNWKLLSVVVAGVILAISGPIGLAIGLVVAMASAWMSNMGNIRQTVTDVINSVKERFSELLGHLGKIGEGISGVWNWLTGRTAEETGAQAATVEANYGYAAETAVGHSSYLASGVDGYMGYAYESADAYSGAAANSIAGNMDYGAASAIDSTAAMADGTNMCMVSVYDTVDQYGTASQESLAANFGVAGAHVDAGLGHAESVTQTRMSNTWKTVQEYVARIKAELATIGVDSARGGGGSERDEVQREKNAMMRGQIEEARKAAANAFKKPVSVPAPSVAAPTMPKGSKGAGAPKGTTAKGKTPKGKTPKETGAARSLSAGKEATPQDALKSSMDAMDAIQKLAEFKKSPAWADFQANESQYYAIANKLAAFGKRILQIWASAGKHFKADQLEGAKALSEGIQAGVNGASNAIKFIADLTAFKNKAGALESLNDSSLLTIVEKLAVFARRVSDTWGKQGKGMDMTLLEAGALLKGTTENATTGLAQTMEFIPKLLSFHNSKSIGALDGVLNPDNPLFVTVERLAIFARQVSVLWGQQGQSLKADLVDAGALLKTAVESATGGLSATINLIPSLLTFGASKASAVLTDPALWTWALDLTNFLSQFSRQVVDRWSAAGAKLEDDQVSATARLKAGIENASAGILSTFAYVSEVLTILQRQATLVQSLGTHQVEITGFSLWMGNWARDISLQFANAGQALGTEVPAQSERLRQSIEHATAGIRTVFSYVEFALVQVTKGNANLQALGAEQANITGFSLWMGNWARDIARQFATAGAALAVETPAAADRLKTSIESATAGILNVFTYVQQIFLVIAKQQGLLQQYGAEQTNITGFSLWMGNWARDIARQFAAAGGALSQDAPAAADRLKSSIESATAGILNVYAYIEKVFVLVARQQDHLQALAGQQANVTGFSLWLGNWARDIARQFALAGSALSQDTSSQASNLKSTIEAATGGILSTFDYIERVFLQVQYGQAHLQALAAQQTNITGFSLWIGNWARDIATQFATAGGALSESAPAAAERLRSASEQAFGGIRSAFEFIEFAFIQVQYHQAQLQRYASQQGNITQFAATVAGWARDIANQFALAAAGLNENVGPQSILLKDAIGNSLAGIQATSDLLQRLAEGARFAGQQGPDPGLASFAQRLIGWAIPIANDMASAALALDTSLAPQAVALTGALQNAFGGLETAYKMWSLLLEYNNKVGLGVPDLQLATRAYELAYWAVQVNNAFNLASEYLQTGLQSSANSMTGALKNALDGLTSAFSLWKLLLDYDKAVGLGVPDLSLATRAYELAWWATQVVNSFNVSTDTLQTNLQTTANAFTLAVKNALEGLTASFAVWKLLLDYNKAVGLGVPDPALATRAYELAQWAVKVSNKWNEASALLDQSLTDAGAKLSSSIQNALNGLKSAVDAARLLSSLSDPRNTIAFSDALITQAETIAAWAKKVGDKWNAAAGDTGQELVDAGGRLATSIQNALNGLRSAVDAARLLSSLSDPRNAVAFTDALLTQADTIGAWAKRLADKWNLAAGDIGQDLVDAGGRLSTSLQNAHTGLQASVETARLLSSLSDPRNAVAFTDALITQAASIAAWANRLASAWNSAAGTLSQDVVDAGGRLSTSMQNALAGIKATIELGRLLASLSDPRQAVTFSDALVTQAESLAGWAKRLQEKWTQAAGALTQELVDAGGRLSTSIQNSASGIKSTVELIRTLQDLQKPNQGVVLMDALEQQAVLLAGWANRLAAAWNGATVNFNTELVDAGGKLSTAVQNGLSGIRSTLDLIRTLLAWNKSSTTYDMTALEATVTQLATDARSLALKFLDAAAGFQQDQGAAEALAKAVQSTQSVLNVAFELIPRLAEWNKKPVRVNEAMLLAVDHVGADMRLVFDHLRTVAGDLASDAADAVEVFQKGVGASASLLKDAFELFPRLFAYLPGHQRLGLAIQEKLNQVIADLKQVFLQFKVQAQDPEINSLATQAVEALQKGFGAAASAITTYLDLQAKMQEQTQAGGMHGNLYGTFAQSSPGGSVAEWAKGFMADLKAAFDEFRTLGSQYSESDLQQASELGGAVKTVFDALKSSIDTMRSFEVGVSGSAITNLSTWLFDLFNVFEQQRSRAGAATEVATALSAVTGAIQGLQVDFGTTGKTLGVALMDGILDGIKSKKAGVLAELGTLLSAIAQAGTSPTPTPPPDTGERRRFTRPAGESGQGGGDTVTYITYILVQNGTSSSEFSNSESSFQRMQTKAGF